MDRPGERAFTLHVGLGTFRPIEVEGIEDHRLHAEWAELTDDSATRLNARRAAGGRIVAVGTTSARVLETAFTGGGEIVPFTGETALDLRPGHTFRAVGALVTNFHVPRSSLLVLVSAFAGMELVREATKLKMDRPEVRPDRGRSAHFCGNTGDGSESRARPDGPANLRGAVAWA